MSSFMGTNKNTQDDTINYFREINMMTKHTARRRLAIGQTVDVLYTALSNATEKIQQCA